MKIQEEAFLQGDDITPLVSQILSTCPLIKESRLSIYLQSYYNHYGYDRFLNDLNTDIIYDFKNNCGFKNKIFFFTDYFDKVDDEHVIGKGFFDYSDKVGFRIIKKYGESAECTDFYVNLGVLSIHSREINGRNLITAAENFKLSVLEASLKYVQPFPEGAVLMKPFDNAFYNPLYGTIDLTSF